MDRTATLDRPETVPDGRLDPEAAARFRSRCRAFLAEHATSDPAEGEADPRGDRALAAGRSFQRALSSAGLAGLAIPRAYGGQGLGDDHERIWREEAAGFPPMTAELSISLGNCLPTLLQFGTEEQKRRHVPRLLSGREVWCQLFSEPGAGSDVAAVQTRAVRVEGGWVLNGQKVWTTLAHVCEYGILLARTDPAAPKHEGLSMFIVDLRAPGIEVRPIHQIDGGLHFNEVFLTDVIVPEAYLMPPAGSGWRVARGMLTNQRLARGTGQANGVLHARFDRLAAEARRRGRLDADAPGTATVRDELARLSIAEVCQSLVALRTRDLTRAGRAPGASGSVAKLLGALVAARYADLSHRLVGPDSQAWERVEAPAAGSIGADEAEGCADADGGRWAREALTALSLGIAGGTNEIQRNIIGEAVLGLPREPSVEQRAR
jgi:alkylation response protein AidB-like acyl-CoA dehydrogenase